MSVLATSRALRPWHLSRLREMAPFLPNQSMKPMAPARYFATLLATNFDNQMATFHRFCAKLDLNMDHHPSPHGSPIPKRSALPKAMK
jgi:hypothetical protein